MNFSTDDLANTRNPLGELLESVKCDIEAHLRDAISAIEGRVPELAEVAFHGHRIIYPDGAEEYLWRGKSILRVHPIADPLCVGFTITRREPRKNCDTGTAATLEATKGGGGNPANGVTGPGVGIENIESPTIFPASAKW